MLRLRRHVYLDNNATTPPSSAVCKRMESVLKECYGNPSSLYRSARDAAAILEESRISIASAIGAQPEEIVFTGCASEANNQILKSFLSNPPLKRNTVISSPIEHPSVMNALLHMQSFGFNIVFCPVDRNGRIIMKELLRLVDNTTLLVCCMFANNEIGTIQDIREIASIAHSNGALVMSDCVQALGKVPVDVKELDIDYATFSAHKIHGPKGIGALYVREGSPIAALIHGGHQEGGLRAGTEGIHNIAGFATAAETMVTMLAKMPDILRLKKNFSDDLLKIFPQIESNSPSDNCLPNTISIRFPGFDNAEFIGYLDYHGICVSAGSACNTQENKPSHVLKAIGLSDDAARETLRFSLGANTSERDISYSIRVIHDYLTAKSLPVTMFRPAQVDENLLFNEKTYVLDIRYRYDRKLLKGLPNSHEVQLFFLKRYLSQIPKNKFILIACQAGTDGPLAAYYLRSRGFRNVGFVAGGIVGWKLLRPDLYEKLGGAGTIQLKPEE